MPRRVPVNIGYHWYHEQKERSEVLAATLYYTNYKANLSSGKEGTGYPSEQVRTTMRKSSPKDRTSRLLTLRCGLRHSTRPLAHPRR